MVSVPSAGGAPLGRGHPLNRGAFLAAAYGHATCHGAKLALPLVTLTVGAESFGVDPSRVGWAVSAFTLSMGLTSVPAGLAGDHWGTGRVLTVYFWALGLAAIACGLAHGFVPFLVAHIALGAAAGLFHPAALGLVSLVTPAENLGRAMGLFGVAGSAGLALMPWVMGMAEGPEGWRVGFLLLGAASLAGAVACHVGLRTGWLPSGLGAAPRALQRDGERLTGVLLLLLVIMGVNAFISSGWETLFPQTVADQGLQVVEPWMISTGVLVVGGLGQYVGGILARDAFAAGRLAIILVVQCLVLLGTSTALDAGVLPFAFLASFAFLNYGTQPIENRLIAAFTSTRRRSAAYALKFVVALIVATPAASVVASMYDATGESQAAFRMLSAVSLVAVFAGWLFLRQRRAARRTPRSA